MVNILVEEVDFEGKCPGGNFLGIEYRVGLSDTKIQNMWIAVDKWKGPMWFLRLGRCC